MWTLFQRDKDSSPGPKFNLPVGVLTWDAEGTPPSPHWQREEGGDISWERIEHTGALDFPLCLSAIVTSLCLIGVWNEILNLYRNMA